MINAKTTLSQAVAIAMVRSSLSVGGVRQTFPLWTHLGCGGLLPSFRIWKEMTLLCSWYEHEPPLHVFYGETASGDAWEVRLSHESEWGSNELPSLLRATFDPSVDDQDAHDRLVASLVRDQVTTRVRV